MLVPNCAEDIPRPRINHHCPDCKSEQTFVMLNEYFEVGRIVNAETWGEVYRLQYACVGCQEFEIYFMIKVAKDGRSVMKIGQLPAWSVKGDPAVETLLGAHKDYLSRALVSESQGYGIGAFAYYRRIVEEIIDSLLADVADLIGPEEREKYLAALSSASRTRVTAEKIEIVKDLLPPILRPEGMNPLKTLHETLSEGLHAESEERCLELAMEVREILVFLATQVAISRTAARSFTSNMRSLLEKKSVRSQPAKS